MSEDALRALFLHGTECAIKALQRGPGHMLTPQVFGEKTEHSHGSDYIRVGDMGGGPVAFFGVARLEFIAHQVLRYVFISSATISNLATGENAEGVMIVACDREGRSLMQRARVERDAEGVFTTLTDNEMMPAAASGPAADLLPQHPPNESEASAARRILDFAMSPPAAGDEMPPRPLQEGPHATPGKPRGSSDVDGGETVN